MTRDLPAANQTRWQEVIGVSDLSPVCQSFVPACLFCASSCLVSVPSVIHAGVLVRALVIVAHLSITRSLGELFANDSNEKRVSGVTERRDGEKSSRKERAADVCPCFQFVSGQRSTLRWSFIIPHLWKYGRVPVTRHVKTFSSDGEIRRFSIRLILVLSILWLSELLRL